MAAKGALCMTTGMTGTIKGAPDDASAWLSAIVDDSQDAIVSKTLDGVITSWNAGAQRLFGFSREEAVGQPITIIIPDDRLHEEEEIITRLRASQRIERMETVRRNRDGALLHVEVTISPVRDRSGAIIGASKIARDISDRMRHAEDQALLVREMHHRIKNLLSVVQALIGVGRRRAQHVDLFADELTTRIGALATAQQLVLREPGAGGGTIALGEVMATLMAPYGADRISMASCDIPVGEQAVTSLALLLHELATNATKYGALSNEYGQLRIDIVEEPDRVDIRWCEAGGNPPDDGRRGFGSDLIRAALRGLRGTMQREWDGTGLTTWLQLDREALSH